MDINTNKKYTVNQISQSKPNVARSKNLLVGFIGNSMNGGHNRAIAYKQVMAGERIHEYKIQAKIKTLTPLTPPYQQLKCTVRSYFVPNSRIWENAEKYTAQKGGSAEIKIKEIPNIGGKTLWQMQDISQNYETYITNTEWWRNAYISSYIPRIGEMTNTDEGLDQIIMPKISVLPLRGRKAIYNDMERNKEYDAELQEYKSDEVSNAEWESYNPADYRNQDIIQMRAKRPNSYYSNYRTEIQGELTDPNDISQDPASFLTNWIQLENKISELRAQAENAQKNDWEIIAEIRGSKVALQGKVQLIGESTFNLNYASVTQNSYNNSEEVENVNFKVLGQQGAYSYTEIEIPCFAGFEAIEEGYIHIIATVWAETVFESGVDRLELNVTPLDQYRPDLVEEKQDVLYEIETGTKNYNVIVNPTRTVGFKRRFSEYFKLPNVIAGDMTTANYYRINSREQGEVWFEQDNEIYTQKSYQFYEEDKNFYIDDTNGQLIPKKEWMDYTDLMINKNLAVKETIEYNEMQDGTYIAWVRGQQQIFIVGKCFCTVDMPIDEEIKNNYTTWGEH